MTTKTATVENGTWKIGEVALATGKHTYTAVASQPSEIENGIGESTPLTFEIDTEPPTVTLNAVAEVSGDTTPSFSGTTNEAKIVTVKVYEGVKTTGTPIRTLQAQPNGGVWATAAVSPKLGNGTYTAVASQPSSIKGDPEGTSGPAKFEINTEAPIVTLERPISPSKNTTPSFKGTAERSDAGDDRGVQGCGHRRRNRGSGHSERYAGDMVVERSCSEPAKGRRTVYRSCHPNWSGQRARRERVGHLRG